MKRIYMDHAATTPVAPEVLIAMLPFLRTHCGNPSSLYQEGRQARSAVDKARSQVAAAIGAEASEIVFTSGGTESDNAALFGTARKYAGKKKHIITTAIEHHAVLHSCAALEKMGWEISYLQPNAEGILSPQQVADAIRPDSALISVMTANSEIGSIQPIGDIGALARARGILFHTDAVQALGAIPLDVQAMNVDMLSLSAHKIYGPKGVGALYLRRGLSLSPLLFGGAQERERRGGTENVPGIVGLGVAAERATERMAVESPRLAGLRDALIDGLQRAIPGCRLNGPRGTLRLPNNVNLSFEGVQQDALLVNLDFAGIAASGGSACASGALNPSHVLVAIGLSEAAARGALRLTLGEENTAEDVGQVLEALPPIVDKLRGESRL